MREFIQFIQGNKRASYRPKSRSISPRKIVEFLESIDANPAPDRELTELRLRGLKREIQLRQELLKQCIPSKDVQEIFDDQTRQNISQKVKKGSILAIKDRGRWWYPLWQFDAGGPDRMVAGLVKVLKVIHGSSLEKMVWLSTKNKVFEDRRPIDALKSGEMERVLAEAEGIGAAAL